MLPDAGHRPAGGSFVAQAVDRGDSGLQRRALAKEDELVRVGLADDASGVADDGGGLGHVVKDMLELDQLFQLIENDVAQWNDSRIDINLRSSPMRLMRRGGNMKTLHAKLRALEESLRLLTDDSCLSSGTVSSETPGREMLIE